MLANPYVAINAEHDIDLTAIIRGGEGPDLPPRANDAGAAAAGTCDGEKDAVAEFAVFETARMQARGPILIDPLHLRDDEFALPQERPHGEFIRAGSFPQYASRQVYGGEREVGEERSGEVDFPAFGLYFDDAADDEVADFGCVAGAEGADGEEFVGFLEGAGEGGENYGVGWGGVGAVASKKGGELAETMFAQGLGVSWEERFTSSIAGRR